MVDARKGRWDTDCPEMVFKCPRKTHIQVQLLSWLHTGFWYRFTVRNGYTPEQNTREVWQLGETGNIVRWRNGRRTVVLYVCGERNIRTGSSPVLTTKNKSVRWRIHPNTQHELRWSCRSSIKSSEAESKLGICFLVKSEWLAIVG